MSEVPLYAVDWLDEDHCAIDSMHQYAFDMVFQHEREVQYTTHSEAWKLVYAQFASSSEEDAPVCRRSAILTARRGVGWGGDAREASERETLFWYRNGRYRGTSLTKNCPPHKPTVGLEA